ncbi:DUF6542 domain-containing protein [Streptomyces sp. NPDC057638]|uniref:DUF6542 domain-containing protein n=1 Tax=Streptomyces sp. NPDC057638 TaxID=3346190 RepID=UPI0036906490
MEQPRIRPPQSRPRPQPPRPPSVPPGGRPARPTGPGAGARPVAPVVRALRRLPSPRLTGLGGGLFALVAMVLVGALDWLLLDGSPTAYGLLFLPVCVLTALWVREADLVTAPVGVPIAFAVGIVPVSGGAGGTGGHLMALITSLAMHAGWLYAGTLIAGLIACVRKVRAMGRRTRRVRSGAPRVRGAAGVRGAGAPRVRG